MKNTAILPLLLVLGAVSLVRSDSDCIDSYTDMTVLPGFADCNHTLSFALDSGRCGFDGNDDNVTL